MIRLQPRLVALLTAGLLALSLLVGLYGVEETGPLWPDAPRYANGAAMIHDWLLSGELNDPYGFAQRNYARYPAFSIPYHPPAYPALLATFFLVFGQSYFTARLFIALSLFLTALGVVLIVRALGGSTTTAWASGMLLCLITDIAWWSRTTMSEIPALAFITLASWAFLRWRATDRATWIWLAFGLAEVAFLSRVTTAGIIPCWFLFLLLAGDRQKLRRIELLGPSLLYVLVNGIWVRFVRDFSRYELVDNALGGGSPTDKALAHLSELPNSLGWGLLGLTCVGLVVWLGNLRDRSRASLGLFWMLWFGCFLAFSSTTLGGGFQQRYFLFALVPLAGLAGLSVSGIGKLSKPSGLGLALIVCLALGLNARALSKIPRGVVGHQDVANYLSRTVTPGNVFLSVWFDQDLIFRFRSIESPGTPKANRQFIRGDRTLAIRLASYADHRTENLATTPEQVLDLLERGRVRYLVVSRGEADSWLESRLAPDMRLVREAVDLNPDLFKKVHSSPLSVAFSSQSPATSQVEVWEFMGELLPGPSELDVVVPTADLKLRTAGD